MFSCVCVFFFWSENSSLPECLLSLYAVFLKNTRILIFPQITSSQGRLDLVEIFESNTCDTLDRAFFSLLFWCVCVCVALGGCSRRFCDSKKLQIHGRSHRGMSNDNHAIYGAPLQSAVRRNPLDFLRRAPNPPGAPEEEPEEEVFLVRGARRSAEIGRFHTGPLQ